MPTLVKIDSSIFGERQGSFDLRRISSGWTKYVHAGAVNMDWASIG